MKLILCLLAIIFMTIGCNQKSKPLTPKEKEKISIICNKIISSKKYQCSKTDFNDFKKYISLERVYINSRGVYLVQQEELFGKQKGIFYLDTDSDFNPEIPMGASYKKISNRLYSYTIYD